MKGPSFPIRGRIAQCWLFVYRTPVETAAELLPRQIEAVTKNGFAFWNIVVCRLEGMRPAPLPVVVGLGYWHVAYRLHVRATRESGEPIEGLYFARSDCDRRVVAVAGNWFTDFNFHVARIRVGAHTSGVTGKVTSPDAAASFEIDRRAIPQLTPGSPFASLGEAASALEYKPAALSAVGSAEVNMVKVRRDAAAWHWKPVAVKEARWQFLEKYDASFELCYEVGPVDYLWEARRSVRVRPCAS
jgi:hypothetical protein